MDTERITEVAVYIVKAVMHGGKGTWREAVSQRWPDLTSTEFGEACRVARASLQEEAEILKERIDERTAEIERSRLEWQ